MTTDTTPATGSDESRALDTGRVTTEQLTAIWNDYDALEELARSINQDILWIEVQLGNKNRMVRRVDPTIGEYEERQDGHEYFNWRHRAVAARSHKIQLYRQMKARLKELRVAQNHTYDPADPRSNSQVRHTLDERLGAIEEHMASLDAKLDRLLSSPLREKP